MLLLVQLFLADKPELMNMAESQNKEKEVSRDFRILIESLRCTIDELTQKNPSVKMKTGDSIDFIQELKKIEVFSGKKGKSYIVPAEDTSVELGPPSSSSVDLLMTTFRHDLVSDGRITVIGDDLNELTGKKKAFLQCVLLSVNEGADILSIENNRYLFNRLSGYMVRSIPGRLWVRIHRKLMKKGFSFLHLGAAIHEAFHSASDGIRGCELIFAAGENGLIDSFSEISEKAKALGFKNRKLQLEEDGTYSCDDYDCESCDEKVSCDVLRDIIVSRKKEKSGKQEPVSKGTV